MLLFELITYANNSVSEMVMIFSVSSGYVSFKKPIAKHLEFLSKCHIRFDPEFRSLVSNQYQENEKQGFFQRILLFEE
jgi:hypothetical protein